MRRATLFHAFRVASAYQIAAIGLLALAGPARAADQAFNVIITADSTPVMASEKPIGEVKKGTRLTVSQTNGDWYLIDLPGANPPRQGWIRKSDVQSVSIAATTRQLTAEQKKEQLKERDRYAQQSVELAHAGKFSEAAAAAEKLLAIQREAAGISFEELTTLLTFTAWLHDKQEDFTAARKLREEVLAIKTKQLGPEHWQVTDARLAVEKTVLLEKLDPPQRRLVAQADQLNSKAEFLYGQGKFGEAVEPARQAADIRRKVLGEQHPDYALSLNNLGELCRSMRDYARAEILLRQSLKLRKQALGEKHPAYATSLNTLALLYQDMHDYDRAEPLGRQALEIIKQALGEQDPQYAQCLNNLCVLYYTMCAGLRKDGHPAEAVAAAEKGLAVQRKLSGAAHDKLTAGIAMTAGLHEDLEEFVAARKLREEVLAIKTKQLGPEHWEVTDARLALENTALLNRLDPAKRKQLTEAHNLNAKVGTLVGQGKFGEAVESARQEADINRTILGEEHPDYALSLSNLAGLYAVMGDYARAEPLNRQVLDLRKKALGERHPNYAVSLNNLAEVYRNMGDYARAEPLYRQALEIYKQTVGEKHIDYATSLDNLAGLYQAMDDYTRAEPLYRQALEIRQQALGNEHPDYATSLNNLAGLYHAMGDNSRAEPLYRQAMEIQKQILGEKHPDYAASLNNLAGLYEAKGDYARAEPLYRQALNIQKQAWGEKDPHYATNLANLAMLMVEMNKPQESVALAAEAVKIVRRQLDATADVQSERQQLRMNQSLRVYLDCFLSTTAESQSADEVYSAVLAWKGAVTARQQATRRMREVRQGQLDPRTAELYQLLIDKTAALATASRAVPETSEAEAYRARLVQLFNEVESIQQKLAAVSVSYRQELEQRKRTPSELQRALPANTVLVDLLEYGHYGPGKGGHKLIPQKRLVAFIVRADQPVERIELGSAEPITNTILAWRRDFGQVRGGETENPGQQLRRLVWEKIEPSLHGAKTVLLSPDGATAQFPWPALPGKAPGSFLIEDTAIAIVPIPRMLPELLSSRDAFGAASGKADEAPSLLLVGDVNFGADTSSNVLSDDDRGAAVGDERPMWPSLPGTAAEVAAIRATLVGRYKQASPVELTEDRATKSAVRRQLGDYRYVHFSTHGFFAPPAVRSALNNSSRRSELSASQQEVAGFNPGLLSGLVLAGANRPPKFGRDDGILTAMEVAGLDLGHVELATLSACETGLGESAGGEGLLGLQRAFQTAGAKTVVASLWKVSDKATQTLMARFYDNLWNKKMTKLESLLEAQRWLLREGPKQPDLFRGEDFLPTPEEASLKSGRLSPRYWAAFELSGDWR